jgi:hypothetical protein
MILAGFATTNVQMKIGGIPIPRSNRAAFDVYFSSEVLMLTIAGGILIAFGAFWALSFFLLFIASRLFKTR